MMALRLLGQSVQAFVRDVRVGLLESRLAPPAAALTVVDIGGGGLVAEEEHAFWLAAPKKRVSRSRKRKRTSTMGLRPIVHFDVCELCGKPKLHLRLWPCCLEAMAQKTAETKAKN
ncbi:hypothetical protein CTAYLR_008860 [Chrysophaeum taylorii]|uniref:Large ribosomal subunit protein bL32m n=1 Tax=Chrysophaeum taylorii TaxID=2483200 RepID=A0AAD7UQ49_9STRA|nr:hypothetical protein CTAYLR_008860 [Chrysophaeum taylorii]